MSEPLARLHVHLVFSTKSRRPVIGDPIRGSLHAYLASILNEMKCQAELINSVEVHLPILFDLARTVPVSAAVEEVKKSSSKWIKTQPGNFRDFAWQAGYGAFAVSESNMEATRKYIANQREHHRVTTFQEEYLKFLKRHRIAFDERYVWD